ncbi:MAG: beta-phosphoglucomutase [Clostridia bacterium]|nr:beta-phosphoglucomutase [Clostridia bacterium]
MKRYSGVIFDMDGVICSTAEYHYQSWKAVTDEIGVYFDKSINNRLRGISRMDSLEIILEQSKHFFSLKEKEAFAEKKNAIYLELIQNITPADLSCEVRSTLDELRAFGLKLAIGSSSRNTGVILERLGLSGFFDAVSDGNNIEKGKPDPQVFTMAAAYIGLLPAECLVVEDAEAGILAAANGGFDSAGLDEAAVCGKATYSIKAFSELKQICMG